MAPRTRVDPTPAITPPRLTTMDQLKEQLTSFAEGRHTVHRLMDLVQDRLESILDEVRPEDAGKLGVWLNSRIQAGTGEAKIKWDLIRGVFETVRDARGPTLPSERPLSAAVSDVSLRPGLIEFSETRGTPEIKIPTWPREDPVLAVETTPLPADLRSAPVPGPWRAAGFVWIALGVTVLFAFAIGGSYWLTRRGQTPVTAEVAPPPPATADLVVALPKPRLVVGLPALTDHPLPDPAAAVPTVAQLPPLGLSRSPQFAIGAFPMTRLLGLDMPAPIGERSPPTEGLPSPVSPPEPALNATSRHRLSPVAAPRKSPGAVKF
jgi:hypothetical protein